MAIGSRHRHCTKLQARQKNDLLRGEAGKNNFTEDSSVNCFDDIEIKIYSQICTQWDLELKPASQSIEEYNVLFTHLGFIENHRLRPQTSRKLLRKWY